jgi:Putative DNA-binding domain
MKFRFNPFDTELKRIEPADLQKLIYVSEGWYIEYKSEVIQVKAIGKSISAFANQYGGWLVVGVKENPGTHTADSFPGIEESAVYHFLQNIREASKDILNPEVFYEAREFKGPIQEINLPTGRSVIVVRVPPGAETPYIHADGRVYRRVADSSAPKPETDRSTLDRLWDRAEKARMRLEKFVTRSPVTSKAEENNTYLHLSILSDPYEVRGDWFNGTFTDFSKIMRGNPIPFDNIYSSSGGFVARQTNGNDPYHRIFTWEFDLHCHSFITLPINLSSEPYLPTLISYSFGRQYNDLLDKANVSSSRLLDLNIMLDALTAIVARHRSLAMHAGVHGPFYVKAHLENVWRTVPFLDTEKFMVYVHENGIPVVQEEDVLSPPGTALETFVLLPEKTELSEDAKDSLIDAIRIGCVIFEALGVPRELYVDDVSALEELFQVGQRFKAAQQLRNATAQR